MSNTTNGNQPGGTNTNLGSLGGIFNSGLPGGVQQGATQNNSNTGIQTNQSTLFNPNNPFSLDQTNKPVNLFGSQNQVSNNTTGDKSTIPSFASSNTIINPQTSNKGGQGGSALLTGSSNLNQTGFFPNLSNSSSEQTGGEHVKKSFSFNPQASSQNSSDSSASGFQGTFGAKPKETDTTGSLSTGETGGLNKNITKPPFSISGIGSGGNANTDSLFKIAQLGQTSNTFNTNLITDNTNNIDKTKSNNASLSFNPPSIGFGNFLKTDNPEMNKTSDNQNVTNGTTTGESNSKPGFNFNLGGKANPITNQADNKPSGTLFSSKTETITKGGLFGTTVGKETGLTSGTAEKTATAGTGLSEKSSANLFGGISLGAKPAETTSSATSSLSFGAKLGTGLSTNPIPTQTEKTTQEVKPNEFFSKKEEVGGLKTKPEDQKKEEIKITDTKAIPQYKQLDDVALNSLMKKSIEDVINKWKNDLDTQVDKFENNAEKLKQFEFMFLKNFESICSLYDLINNLKEDGLKTMKTLEDVSTEEDYVIEQLNIMEKQIDQYLEVAEKNNFDKGIQSENRNYIYNTAIDISKSADDIQRDIDEINSKITEPLVVTKDESLNTLNYENPQLRESISLDKNEFTSILNSYYNSLRSIQFMEQNLVSKINSIDSEINERRREKEKEMKYY